MIQIERSNIPIFQVWDSNIIFLNILTISELYWTFHYKSYNCSKNVLLKFDSSTSKKIYDF
jgi:hypothetical protein